MIVIFSDDRIIISSLINIRTDEIVLKYDNNLFMGGKINIILDIYTFVVKE